jgi:hypothetical protein
MYFIAVYQRILTLPIVQDNIHQKLHLSNTTSAGKGTVSRYCGGLYITVYYFTLKLLLLFKLFIFRFILIYRYNVQYNMLSIGDGTFTLKKSEQVF